MGGIAALGVVGAAAAWLATRPPEPPAVVTPPQVALVDPPTPMVVEDAGPSLAIDAGAEVAVMLEPVADAGSTVEALDAGLLAGVKPPRPVLIRRELPAPTNKQLKDRISKLSVRAKSKKDLDPTALQFLGRYSIEATAADTPARRLKLDRALTDWERNFLKR